MERDKILFPVSEFSNDTECSYKKIKIYIDKGNQEEIISLLEVNPKKVKRVLHEILSDRYNEDLYRMEAKSLTAIKLKGKLNSRIYCREYKGEDDKKIVILILPWRHKDCQKLDKRLKNQIDSTLSYEYSIEWEWG